MANEDFEAAAARAAVKALDTAEKLMGFTQTLIAGGRISGDYLHAHAQAVRALAEAAQLLREGAKPEAEPSRPATPSMSSQRIR